MVLINDRSIVKYPKLCSELINFDDETGLWWTENWQLWTVYLKVCFLMTPVICLLEGSKEITEKTKRLLIEQP